MEFSFTKEQEELRAEVDAVLEKHLKLGNIRLMTDGYPRQRNTPGIIAVSKEMVEHGWCGMTWPREYGGGGKSYLDRLIVVEEYLKYCFIPTWSTTDRQQGPSIIKFGTEEQKKFFLPRMVRGEIRLAVGMSEPEAGSDLAGIKTTAIEKDDHFLINGQKVWTSGAADCDYLYMVARTDPNERGAKGVSEFIIDLKLPGIDVRPLESMGGVNEWNEVFLNDVKVPKSSLIGVKNQGFQQIAQQLDYERSGLERLMVNYPVLVKLIDYARETGLSKNPMVRHKLAELKTEFEAGRLLVYWVAWILSQGKMPNLESGISKAFCTAFEVKLANAATVLLGPYGQLWDGSPWAPITGDACMSYLFSPGYTIQGGTSEILKNVIARRGLGLPSK